jgi:hypothetical protein
MERALMNASLKTRINRTNARLLLLTMLAAPVAPGCVTMYDVSRIVNRYPSADVNHPVVEMICLWQAGEGVNAKGLPCRGFCGQLMFVAVGSPTPAKIHGNMRVYVFDDVGNTDEQATPSEVFEFTPEQWDTFAHPTKLGMTYQVFIPYTRPGMHEANCALRVRYEPTDSGTPVFSQMDPVQLKGKKGSSKSLIADPPDSALPQVDATEGGAALLEKFRMDADPKNSDKEMQKLAAMARRAAEGDDVTRLEALLKESTDPSADQASRDESTPTERRGLGKLIPAK